MQHHIYANYRIDLRIYARIEQKKSLREENFKSLVKSNSVADKRTASYPKTHQGFLFMLNRTSKNSTDYRLIFAP